VRRDVTGDARRQSGAAGDAKKTAPEDREVSDDGTYDTQDGYQEVQRKGAQANCPPQKLAGYWQ